MKIIPSISVSCSPTAGKPTSTAVSNAELFQWSGYAPPGNEQVSWKGKNTVATLKISDQAPEECHNISNETISEKRVSVWGPPIKEIIDKCPALGGQANFVCGQLNVGVSPAAIPSSAITRASSSRTTTSSAAATTGTQLTCAGDASKGKFVPADFLTDTITTFCLHASDQKDDSENIVRDPGSGSLQRSYNAGQRWEFSLSIDWPTDLNVNDNFAQNCESYLNEVVNSKNSWAPYVPSD